MSYEGILWNVEGFWGKTGISVEIPTSYAKRLMHRRIRNLPTLYTLSLGYSDLSVNSIYYKGWMPFFFRYTEYSNFRSILYYQYWGWLHNAKFLLLTIIFLGKPQTSCTRYTYMYICICTYSLLFIANTMGNINLSWLIVVLIV
jgi:hypothetical protein